MSEETEALMQEFRQSVYERLNSPQALEASPREAIERRAKAYQAWLDSQPSEDEAAALPTALVRHWVAADLSSWRSIDANDTGDATAAVYRNIFVHDTYAELLKELDQALYSEIISRHGSDAGSGNGFSRGDTDRDQENDDKIAKIDISELLKAITYKERRDGSVIYSLNEKPIFIDHGNQLLMVAEAKDDEMAILAGLYMAKQKFGGSIELTGSEEFKRRAIEVLIKHNVPVELNNPAQEAIRREILGLPPIEATPEKPVPPAQTSEPTKDSTGDKGKATSQATSSTEESATNEEPPVNVREGVIVDFGPAPYLFDKKQSKSFYVKLRNSDGEERDTWGVDLARVFRENQIEVGDKVTLNNLGRKQVTVEVPVRGADGRIERYEDKTVHRNEWEAVLLGKMELDDQGPIAEPLSPEELTVSGCDARFAASIGLPGDINDYPDLLPYRAEDHALAVMWDHDRSEEGLKTIENLMSEPKYRAAFQAKLEGEVSKLNAHFRNQLEGSEGYAIAHELLVDAEKRFGPLPEAGSDAFNRIFQLENCWDPDEVIESIEQIDSAYLAQLKNEPAPVDPSQAAELTDQPSSDGENPVEDAEPSDLDAASLEHSQYQAAEGVQTFDADLQRAENLIHVNAAVWWRDQSEAINTWSKSLEEMECDLAALGPEPSADQFYWFDKTGKPVPAPVNEYEWLTAKAFIPNGQAAQPEIEGFGAGYQSNSGVPGDVTGATTSNSTTPQEVGMENADTNAEPKLILRGVTKLENDDFDTTVLLYQGSGDYLHGFVKVNGEKHQVLAFMNERKPDLDHGEIKPNFITLCQPNNDGSDQKWKQIGFGNAVNRRGDGKAVYFDEVLFNVDSQILKAKVTKHVDEDMHRKLGFLEHRKEREKSSASPKSEAPAESVKQQPSPAQPTVKSRARA